MFDNKKATPENDPLQGKFDGMDRELRAPAALKQAAKTGVPLRTGKREGTAVHVRRFSKAIVAYALGVMLFLGVIAVLPGLWESEPISSPGTNVTTTDELVDGTDSSVSPENSDSADVTDTPPIDQTLDSGDEGSFVNDIHVFNSYEEFYQFYRLFQNQNIAPIVTIDSADTINTKCLYSFNGGVISLNDPNRLEYDRKYPESHFGFAFYYNYKDIMRGEYEIGIIGESGVIDTSISNLNDIEIRSTKNHVVDFLSNSHFNLFNPKRTYEILCGDKVLITLTIGGSYIESDKLYQEICEQILNNLVIMGEVNI